MNLHIAKIRAHVLVDKGERQALQFFADLDHGRHITAQAQHITAQAMQMHNIGLIEGVAHDALFELFDFGVDRFADRLVALCDKVEQGIQHKVLAMLQQQRARLTALAHSLV